MRLENDRYYTNGTSTIFSTTLSQEDRGKILGFLSPLDPLAVRLTDEIRTIKRNEAARVDREILKRDVRIYVTEDGNNIELLPPQVLRKRSKHHGAPTKAQRLMAKAKRQVSGLTQAQKADLLRKLQESLS